MGVGSPQNDPPGPPQKDPLGPPQKDPLGPPQKDPRLQGGPRNLSRTQEPLSSLCDAEGGRGDVLGQPGQHVLGREEEDGGLTRFLYYI